MLVLASTGNIGIVSCWYPWPYLYSSQDIRVFWNGASATTRGEVRLLLVTPPLLERSLAQRLPPPHPHTHDLCLLEILSSWAHLYPPGPLMGAVLTSYKFRATKMHFPELLILLQFPVVEFTKLEETLGSVSSNLPTVSAHVRNSEIL
jgi:hypothetical protein